jgi:[histone H3]-trimethyl-L-lysine9/36 demethylase
LENLIVQGPIEQNIFGKGGIYECLHIPKKSVTLEEYKVKAKELDKITDNMDGE